jgi:3-dehydroquinate synthase
VHVGIKAGIVARDERESGVRKTLNFGHTIGHAIESLSGFEMLHGECIAIGMLVETRIGALAGITDSSLTASIGSLLRAAGLPTAAPSSMTADAVIAATRSDKKARAGTVEYALPVRLGEMAGAGGGYATPVPDDIVRAAISDSRASL